MDDNSCPASHDPQLVGDPVDTLTGAVVDRMLDFRLTGPIELRWYRHYDSSLSHRSFTLGTGCAHEFDRSLSLDAEGLLHEEPIRRSLRFPPLINDGEECAFNGITVRRASSTRYLLHRHAEPTMEFVFTPGSNRARLTRLLRGLFQVRFLYDATQKLVGIDDSAGRRITANEDEAGRLTRLAVESTSTKPGYLLVAYRYDERGNLVATENEKGHGYAFAYDEANRMILRRGRKGFQFYYKYDAKGRCIRAMGDDRLYGVALEYKVSGRLTKVTRPDCGVWTYKFTQRGQLEEIIDSLGGVQKFIRDAAGRVALEIDSNGNATQLVYDTAGEAVAKLGPLGHRIPLPEDPDAPEPLSHRIAANSAEYEYGRLLNIETISLPDQAQVGELSFSSEVQSLVFILDERARDPKPKQEFEVRPIGALWWPRPKKGRICNDFAKLLQQRDEFGRLRQWNYDESGNVSEHIDFDGGRWVYDYGSWHFLRGLTNPLGAESRFSYTPYGEVASLTDAGGTYSEYRYDLKDQLVEVRRHGVMRETYTLDTVGNLIAKHATDGRELFRVEIGPGNLPIKRTLASGDEQTFQYDKSGRPLVSSTNKDRVELAYDSLGNCILEKRNGLGLEQRFQGWRKLAETVFSNRFSVRYEWHGNSVLTITDPGGKFHRIQFRGNGLIERSFSNGSHETSQYDNLGRCLFKGVKRANGQDWQRRYHWSGEGELRNIEDNVRGEVHHEYDAAHRLRHRMVNGRKENYEIDLADNLVAQPGLSGVTLREGNRLKTANGFNFEYNDRNHIEIRQSTNSRIRYIYDSRDQLIRVETSEGMWEAEYDTFGRRTRKKWAGQATEYYWNRDQLVVEVYSDGRMRLYIYVDSIALSPFLILDYESLDTPPAECRRYFILTDQIGTPCLVENEQGAEVWRGRISPFGQVEVSSDAKIELNHRFPGHYFDAELGLHYNRFRYYDPTLGRYLQSDPWGIAGGYNLYSYLPNPLVAADVRGLGGGDESDDSNDPNKPKDGKEGTKKTSPSGGDAEPDLSNLPANVRFRTSKTDKKGRPFGTPKNPNEPTTEDLNPRIQNVPAGELAGKMDPLHPTNEQQGGSISKMSNDELTKFRPEDPISGRPKPDGGLDQTGGHHRTAEIDRRVQSGELPPDTPVPVLVHE